MTFESPFSLLGLLLLLPLIWLHLRRHRETTVRFPAMEILRRIVVRRHLENRTRFLLLLILRAAVLCAFTLAAARPSIAVWRPGGIRSGPTLSQVMIIDDSASMMQKDEDGRSAFSLALTHAMAELDRLRPEDAVHILLAGRPPRPVLDGFTTDRAPVAAALASLRPGFRTNDTERAIEEASLLLQDARTPQTEILFITDLCGDPPSKAVLRGLSANLRVVGTMPRAPRNVSIDRVDVAAGASGGPLEMAISVRVTNRDAFRRRLLPLKLFLDDQPAAAGTMDIPAGGTATKEFSHRFDDKGLHRGVVQIEGDRMAADDRRWFTADVRRAINVLIINGDNRPGSYRDETFYLSRALETPVPGDYPLAVQMVDPETAKVTPFEDQSVIFLAGVNEPSPALGDRLVAWVEAGGGLFVSPGTGPLSWRHLQTVLPGRIRATRKHPASGGYRPGAMDLAHPVFAGFEGGLTGLENLTAATHLLLEPDPSLDRAVLAQFEDSAPLLVERKVASGRVMLLTTTVDRDWTTLPIQPGFLPLMQRSVRYLAASLDDRQPRSVPVGQAVPLEVVEGMRQLIVRTPGGRNVAFSANRLADQTRLWFKDTSAPGIYRVYSRMPGYGGLVEQTAAAFTVNVSPEESDLTRTWSPSDGGDDSDGLYEAVKGHLPIWSYLLLAGILLLLAETIASGWGLRKSHLGKGRT